MTADVMPMMGMEGEMFEPGMAPLVEGELGAHVVVVDGQLATEAELLAQLFELAALMPNMITQAKMPEGKTFIHITPEQMQQMDDIHVMLRELKSPTDRKNSEAPQTTRPEIAKMAQKPEVHRSLFSLASTMNSAAARRTEPVKAVSQPATIQAAVPMTAQKSTQKTNSHLRVEEREGGGQKHNQQQDEQKKRKDQGYIKKVSGKKATVGTTGGPSSNEPVTLGGVENIYIKFMALMARILGQAEAEAHQLYIKIKDRTDQIDTLSLLMAKVNNSPKDVDWSNDPKMQELVQRAREIGVDLPEGKYKWEESEKHLLKENIQMRKDSMEKITQLERTDMQRYLQEASQCHQARSNVLKLLKEVIDTIIHNMRP